MFQIRQLLYLLLIVALLPIICFAETFPGFPMAFWGSATLNGSSMSAGTTIRAYCNNASLIGEIIMVEDGIYGYDSATKNKLLVSNCEDKIVFKYLLQGTGIDLTGNTEVSYADGFEPGKTVKKDLVFTLVVSPPPTSSGGGGGGGGGGSGTTTTTTLKGDANNDNKVDILDFNLLMINWGKAGTSVADFNGDNKVDIFDFNFLMINWTG